MKKLTSFLLILVIVAGALSACSEKPVLQTETVPESTTAPEKKQETPAEIKKQFKLADFRGEAYVTRDSKPVFKFSRGKTAAKNGSAIDENTAFCIASATKQFTAAAILRLKEKGLLSLDDTIDLYFPDYKLGKKNTIHNLLAMRSGIPDYTNEEAELKKCGVKRNGKYKPNRSAVRKWILSQKLNFKPGKYYQYSNSNYILLSEIVEQVSGMNYGTYLRKQFFKPLEMTGTGFIESYDKKSRNFAKPLKESTRSELYYRGVNFGSGNIISTAADLAKWLDALDGGQVVNPESFKEMTSSYTTEGSMEFGYGYGLMIENTDTYFHLGGIGSYSSFVMVDKATKNHIIILSNTTSEYIKSLGVILDKELPTDKK